MALSTVRGVIDRRMLINFRVRPEVLERILPDRFRPQVVRGWGVAGICLIRFRQMRPAFLPAWCGLTSENAAHRFAVEWDSAEGVCSGVYVPRRETSSRLNALAGGRLFSSRMKRAKFDSRESGGEYRLCVTDGGSEPLLDVAARETDLFPSSSLFESLAEVSEFFRIGSVGYSDSQRADEYDGVELCPDTWHTSPLDVKALSSRFFDDRTVFPQGTIEFDNALLMRGIAHEWRSCGRLCSADRST